MMTIALLQAACGEEVIGPMVRIPPGNYSIEKRGKFDNCRMSLNGSSLLEVNSHLVLSTHSSIRVEATNADNLTVRFLRSD